MIEVSAHDHFADVRYHSNGDVANKQFYHNMIVSPGISSLKNQNPGYAVFDIDSSFIPSNLRMTYLDIEKTYDISKSLIKSATLPFRSVMLSDYGLN